MIGCIRVSAATLQILSQTEKFGKIFGDIRIDDDGRLATHIGSENSNAFVRGIGEYSTGKHKIRFSFEKQSLTFTTWFDIVSKRPLAYKDEPTDIVCGWTSNDEVWENYQELITDNNFQDMRGKATFEIEVELDCDNKKFRYVNQKTKNKRSINVDIGICPFPWQIRFYMFEVGDCVRLLT